MSASHRTSSPAHPIESWTVKVRERGVRALPPERLLPDGQPTYVASWIYVFGVASIASLIVIIGSGCILALKGPAWWHETGVGHFFNSIHLWAVELFFFAMVVHLWGKYWMAAWRGGRARVWITGAITFLVAVPCALTGYVSQQNFDAQWISTQAKDAMNSVGVGAFFNLTNFGQMYSYHILLLPIAVVALVSLHVLLVRRNGVVPPFEIDSRKAALASATTSPGAGRLALAAAAPSADFDRGAVMSFLRPKDETRPWKGSYAPYDLVKELCIAVGVIALLAVLLTVLFSSPDDKPSTIAQWSRQLPADFATTAAWSSTGRATPPNTVPPTTTARAACQHFLLPAPAALARRQPSDRHGRRLRGRTAGNDPERPGAARARSPNTRPRPKTQKKEWSEAYAKPLEEYASGGGRKEDAAEHGVGRPDHGHGDCARPAAPARCRR